MECIFIIELTFYFTQSSVIFHTSFPFSATVWLELGNTSKCWHAYQLNFSGERGKHYTASANPPHRAASEAVDSRSR